MSSDSGQRSKRKAEHLNAVRALGEVESHSLFQDISLIPNCAPEISFEDVSLATKLCGINLSSPIIINAMTGGTPEATNINRKLAAAARRHGLAMAVGSETAALQDKSLASTYTVVREENPDGIIISNVGMGTTPDFAQQAINLLEAQCLQVHFNVGQEVFMTEGDRDFRGAIERLSQTVATVNVPVIAKEVGQGIAAEQAVRFLEAGVAAIDVGGRGGTNFIAVEAWRQQHTVSREWKEWGLPTPISLCEVLSVSTNAMDVVASGGIRTGHDIAKAMALGASATGIASPFLRLVSQPDGDAAVDSWIEELHWTLRNLLVLTGSRSWTELQRRPVVIGGRVREWLLARGYEYYLNDVGQRGKVWLSHNPQKNRMGFSK